MDESKIRAKMHEILDLVLDINGMLPRAQEDTGNAPTAFFFFCGHVADVEVSVHEKGWYAYADPDYKSLIRLRDLESNETDSLIEYLKSIKEKENV